MNVGWAPAAGVLARGCVGALGSLALMLAKGTAVGFVAKRETEMETVVGIGGEASVPVVPEGAATPEVVVAALGEV